MQLLFNIIGSTPKPSSSRRIAAVFKPSTGEQKAELPLSSVADLDEAVTVTRAAPGLELENIKATSPRSVPRDFAAGRTQPCNGCATSGIRRDCIVA